MSEAPCNPSNEFTIQIEHRDDAVVAKLAGSLHMEACEHLQTDLLHLVEHSATPLILDLSDLTFICSLGLGALVVTHSQASCKNGVRIVSPGPNIRSLLEVTKLVKLFPPYDSVEAAIEAP